MGETGRRGVGVTVGSIDAADELGVGVDVRVGAVIDFVGDAEACTGTGIGVFVGPRGDSLGDSVGIAEALGDASSLVKLLGLPVNDGDGEILGWRNEMVLIWSVWCLAGRLMLES